MATRNLSQRWRSNRHYAVAITVGLVYGILLRIVMHSNAPKGNGALTFGLYAMSVGFLFVGPFVAGYLAISASQHDGKGHWLEWITLPWVSVLLAYAVLIVVALEGAICLVFAAPACLLFASLGGITAGLIHRNRSRNLGATFCLALLPFAVSALESRIESPLTTRTVNTQILIHAPAATVWQNIERVRPISPSEIKPTWTHRIGFPLPVEATLDHEGIGGVRHASFEGGLVFIETIDAWDPGHAIAFHIAADTAAIPATTLDEHATIGGRYFDVLHGEYRLEPLPNGDTLLHLSSQQRLSTDFNQYAALWTTGVMRDLQNSILEVVKHRCESPSATLKP